MDVVYLLMSMMDLEDKILILNSGEDNRLTREGIFFKELEDTGGWTTAHWTDKPSEAQKFQTEQEAWTFAAATWRDGGTFAKNAFAVIAVPTGSHHW